MDCVASCGFLLFRRLYCIRNYEEEKEGKGRKKGDIFMRVHRSYFSRTEISRGVRKVKGLMRWIFQIFISFLQRLFSVKVFSKGCCFGFWAAILRVVALVVCSLIPSLLALWDISFLSVTKCGKSNYEKPWKI